MVRNILEFRKNLSSYLESVIDFDERITITTKKGNVVIISEKEYKSMLEIINPSFSKNSIIQIKEGEKEDISKMGIYNPKEEW